MLNKISGILSHKSIHNFCIENQGLEWILECSATTLSSLPIIGSETQIYCHLHHKEDLMCLYGFSTLRERELFFNLISVSGVGPKGALKILSGVSADQLAHYLEQEDVKSLSKLPGLGTKTAQKVILQLRGKLVKDQKPVKEAPIEKNELAQALSAMGFDEKEALRVVKMIESDSAISTLQGTQRDQEILRRAIVELSS